MASGASVLFNHAHIVLYTSHVTLAHINPIAHIAFDELYHLVSL